MKKQVYCCSLIYILTFVIIFSTFSFGVAEPDHCLPPQDSRNQTNDLIVIDEKGIPYFDYGFQNGTYVGLQRNPHLVGMEGIDDHIDYILTGNNKSRIYAINNADWLVDHAVSFGNFSLLEYNFTYPSYDMKPPWRSALAQGSAMRALVYAHEMTGDQKYLDIAKKLLNSFFMEVRDGGVTYKTSSNGWWYEQFVDDGSKESRVLNGMAFALISIYKYYDYTGDPDAKYLFDKGITAMVNGLPDYDDNGSSYYDALKRPAGRYHITHIDLLRTLYDITNNETLKIYYEKWNNYCE